MTIPDHNVEYIFIENNNVPFQENNFIEFKINVIDSKKLSKIFSGFMNTDGGYLYLGIDDKGKICGIQLTDKEKDIFLNKIDDLITNHLTPSPKNIYVKIKFIELRSSDLTLIHNTYVIRIDIPKSSFDVCTSDGYGYRRGNASFQSNKKKFVSIGEFDTKILEITKLQKKISDDENKWMQYSTHMTKELITLKKNVNEPKYNMFKINFSTVADCFSCFSCCFSCCSYCSFGNYCGCKFNRNSYKNNKKIDI